MASLGQTTARLARIQRHFSKIMVKAQSAPTKYSSSGHLQAVTGFGSNPGRLRAYAHVPERLQPSPGLVVVLHGCTQNAAGYDLGAGWSTLADRHGFVVLYPEQQSENNPRTCFNWFRPGDTTRGRGEALSIAQMVEHAVKAYGVDRRRIFVTGLSAGGAMTATMLATYPDLFAGGAIIAGLPHRSAGDVQGALDAMFQGRSRPAEEWGDLVRGSSRHQGPWPKVSVWHGDADTTVVPTNATEIVKQWTDVHGVSKAVPETDEVDGQMRQVWRGANGEVLVESYTVAGMGHGTPIGDEGGDSIGQAGPFLLRAGISSSSHIANSFGLTGDVKFAPPRETRAPTLPTTITTVSATPKSVSPPSTGFDPGSVINAALKAAGLMKG